MSKSPVWLFFLFKNCKHAHVWMALFLLSSPIGSQHWDLSHWSELPLSFFPTILFPLFAADSVSAGMISSPLLASFGVTGLHSHLHIRCLYQVVVQSHTITIKIVPFGVGFLFLK